MSRTATAVETPQDSSRLGFAEQAALFFVATAFFSFPYLRSAALNPLGDVADHIAYAGRIAETGEIVSPHFGFQLVTIAVSRILHVDMTTAGILAVGTSYGVMSVMLLRRLSQHISIGPACLYSLLVLVAYPVIAFYIWDGHVLAGYFAAVVYHNPTQQLMKVASLPAWWLFISIFIEKKRAHIGDYAALSCLVVASAICKPSFLIVLVPVAMVVGAYVLAKGSMDALKLTVIVGLPSLAILTVQAWVAYRAGSPSAIAFMPFVVFPDPLNVVAKGLLSTAFPIAVVLCLGRSALTSRLLLAWLFWAVSIFYTVCMVETGPRLPAGNFAWSGQVGMFILYVESLLAFVASRTTPARAAVMMSVGALHVGCGLVAYGVTCLYPQGVWW